MELKHRGLVSPCPPKSYCQCHKQASLGGWRKGLPVDLHILFCILNFSLLFRACCVWGRCALVPRVGAQGHTLKQSGIWKPPEPSMVLTSVSSCSKDRQDHSSRESEGKMPHQLQGDASHWRGWDLNQALGKWAVCPQWLSWVGKQLLIPLGHLAPYPSETPVQSPLFFELNIYLHFFSFDVRFTYKEMYNP